MNNNTKYVPEMRRVVLEITTRCNVRCGFCPNIHDPSRYQGADWGFDNFLEIFPNFHETKHVCFCCAAGEPYLNHDIGRMIKYLKEHNIKTSFFTNGESLAIDARLDETLAYTDIIEWSIVSFRKEVQETWMKGTNVEHLRERIRYICSKFGKVDLGLSILVLEDNVDHLYQIAEEAVSLGCKRIQFSPIRESGMAALKGKTIECLSSGRKEILSENLKKCKELKAHIHIPHELIFEAVVSGSGNKEEQADVKQTRICSDPWMFMNIYYNGLTTACCIRTEPIGNVFTGNEILWENEKYRQYRDSLLTGNLLNVCKNCDMRRMGSIRELQKFLESQNLHKA